MTTTTTTTTAKTVERTGPKNATIRQGHAALRAPYAIIRPAGKGAVAPAPPATSIPDYVPAGAVLALTPEALAAIKGRKHGRAYTDRTLFVVTADKGDKISVAPFGGQAVGHASVVWSFTRHSFAAEVQLADMLPR